jgi:hypothetical protein
MTAAKTMPKMQRNRRIFRKIIQGFLAGFHLAMRTKGIEVRQ